MPSAVTAPSSGQNPTAPTSDALRRTFVVASASLVAVFAASAAPVPVFNVYRAENGLTTADLSLSVVAYFAGTIIALLCLGRLAHHLGRRPVGLATLLTMIAGSLVLLDVTGLGALVAGRFLMGIGAGLASSALTSYIADSAPDRPAWVAGVVTSQAPMLGLTIGSVISGALVQYVPGARVWVYVAMAALLALCLLLMLGCRETGEPTPGVWRSLRPRVSVPARARSLLPVALSVFTATWALGAFYQSFVPTIARDQLHSDNALVVSLLFAAYMAPSVAGAPLVGRLLPATAQRLGMVVFVVGVTGTVTIAFGYGVLALVATAITLVFARNPSGA